MTQRGVTSNFLETRRFTFDLLRLARPQKVVQLILARWTQFSFTKSPDLMEALDILSTPRDERGGGVVFNLIG